MPGVTAYRVFETELGWMGVIARDERVLQVLIGGDEKGITRRIRGTASGSAGVLAEAGRQLAEYASGARQEFDLPLDTDGWSAFRRRVSEACAAIPFGECLTYGDLARLARAPHAARAVGAVMRANPVPIVVPCHRVVDAAGGLRGFSAPGGIDFKARLLRHEGLVVEHGRVTAAAPQTMSPR